MNGVTVQDARKLVGQTIYAVRKDGTQVSGKLVRVSGNRLFVRTESRGKKAQTKAILPLVLFDLLAIGTSPFAFGGGFGFGGFGGGFGYPGFFW